MPSRNQTSLPLVPLMPATSLRMSALLMSALLAGCSSLPSQSDYQDEAQQDQQQAYWQVESQASNTLEEGTSNTASLMSLMSVTGLEALIEQSLSANPGLQQTWLTLQSLRAQYRMTSSDRWPSLSAGLSGQRSGELNTDASATNSVSAELSVSWELDLWGKLANESAAANLNVAEQTLLFESARDSQVAELMGLWLSQIQQQRAIAIQQQQLEALSRNEQTILARYRSGVSDLDELDSAQTSLANARATQADNEYLLGQTRRSLLILLGVGAESQLPAAVAAQLDQIPDAFPDVALPLADLPEQTLERRPDVKAALYAIQSANLSARAAYKNLLPSLSLSAALTGSGDSPAAAFAADPVWSLLGQLTAPLFQGGALKAEAKKADIEAAMAYQSYRETLLTAVQEVTDALALDQSLQRQIEARQQALNSARRNEARYLARYRSGLATLLELLSVQQSRYDLEAQLNSLTYERLNNRIQLGLALGWPAQAPSSSSQVTSQITSQVTSQVSLQDSSQPESQSASQSASQIQSLSQTSPQGES